MTRALRIAADHAAYAGHFPGMPILPGAVLLDEALHALTLELGLDLAQWQISTAKFLRAVRPGARLTLEHTARADATIRVVVHAGAAPVLTVTLTALSRDDISPDP